MSKKFFKKTLSKNAPRWLVLFIDLYIVFNTFIFAYFIRFNFSFNFDTTILIYQLVFVVFIALLSFLAVGTYKGIVRHTGLKDSQNIFLASSLILLFLIGLVVLNREYVYFKNFTIPLSIIVIHYLLNLVFLIVSRFLFKEVYVLMISDLKKDKRKIMIYGAGQSGLITYQVLSRDLSNNVEILGFIDDDKNKIGKRINGLPVFDSELINEYFIKFKKINEIIISIQEIKPIRLLAIFNKLNTLKIKVKIIPPVAAWVDNELKLNQINDVNIEDLLGRNVIKIANPLLNNEFDGETILVTGAAGSIGSEIARQLAKFKYEHLILIDQSESALYDLQQYFLNKKKENISSIVADVRNLNRMEELFKKHNPTIVFHAAAYKHVPLMEEFPYEAVKVNISGTKIIADLASRFKAKKFIMISTDKAVNPTNIMGATKRIAEMYINCLNKQSDTKFITTRFGNVLGSNGSVIPLFKKQIKDGGPLTVTHKDITRFFMTIPEACNLVLEAGAMGKGGEIFVFDMGESIKIYDLAKNMIRLSGFNYPSDIDIKITGLRPGEKIYEELLADGECTAPTYHEKIMIARVQEIEIDVVNKNILELCEINDFLNIEKTVSKMKEIVPEFVSNNSEYEILDTVDRSNT